MIRSWNKTLFIFPAIIFASFQGACPAQKADTLLGKGVSCVFLQKKELMTKNNWRSKPLDVQTATKNIGRYDAFWCAQIMAHHNRPVWQFLRRNRPDQMMFFYVSSCTTRASFGVPTYLDYDYINTRHPEWFLLKDARNVSPKDYKDKDKRIRWAPSDPKGSYYNRFYIDVANKDFQEWAVGQVLDFVSGREQGLSYAYDGLAMDNVYVGKRLHQRFQNKYPHWKYANNFKAWSGGFGDYLKAVKKALNQHGFILVINHNPVGRDRSKDQEIWNTLYESADGILTEQAIRSGWGDSSYLTNDEWLAAISRHEEILEKGLINWWVCQASTSGRGEDDVFLYTYCSWLLTKKPGKSLYGVLTGKESTVWRDEYDLPIGTPTSSRYLRDGCWIRDYSNAKIVVNPTKIMRRIVVDEEKPWLDWESKKAVRELSVPQCSGRILLPISQGPTEKS